MKNFYTLLIAMMVGFMAHATDYYLIGGFNNWTLKDASCKFSDAGNGTFVLDYNGTLTSGFKINDGSWGDIDFGGSGTLELDKEFTLVTKGGNIALASNIEKPHIVLNPTAMTLLITGQQVEAQYKYGIHGQIFGNPSWESKDMEEVDGKWTITADLVPGDFGIKQMDVASGSQTNWYSSADENNIINNLNIGEALNVKVEGTNWTSYIEGRTTLTFDPEAMTLTATMITPDNLYICVNYSTPIELEKAENVFTIKDVKIEVSDETMCEGKHGHFSFESFIDFKEGKSEFIYGASDHYELAVSGQVVQFYRYNSEPEIDMHFPFSWTIEPGIYNITVDFTSMTVNVEKTGELGIEGIATDNTPAIFYNLQGIEVINPSKGFFIKRQNGSSSKVIIK